MRKISWYNSEGKIRFVQNCDSGLEDASCPEEGLSWIEGSPEIINNSTVVNNEIVNGSYDQTQTQEQIRKIRDIRLKNTDWTQAIDSPLSDAKKTEWATYRQSLRDLPSQYSDSDNFDDVVFPTQPD
jgi:erythromycin esterase-like protein